MKIVELEASVYMKEEEGGAYPVLKLEHKDGAAMIGYVTNYSLEHLLELFRSEFEYSSKEKEFEYRVRYKGNKDYFVRVKERGVYEKDFWKSQKV